MGLSHRIIFLVSVATTIIWLIVCACHRFTWTDVKIGTFAVLISTALIGYMAWGFDLLVTKRVMAAFGRWADRYEAKRRAKREVRNVNELRW